MIRPIAFALLFAGSAMVALPTTGSAACYDVGKSTFRCDSPLGKRFLDPTPPRSRYGLSAAEMGRITEKTRQLTEDARQLRKRLWRPESTPEVKRPYTFKLESFGAGRSYQTYRFKDSLGNRYKGSITTLPSGTTIHKGRWR